MNNILSESVLIELLEKIKKALRGVSSGEASNLVFLNLRSFYNFVDNYNYNRYQFAQRIPKGKSQANFQELVAEVTPYIPLTITDENMKRFLDAALSNDETLVKALETEFVENAKAHFINSVYHATDDDDEWNEIVRTCKTIREYKENSALVPFS